MALTFLNMKDLMADEIGDSGNATNNGYYLNMAAREVWRYGAWQERIKRDFAVTVAPISTGTVTFTNGSTTVDGSGVPDFTSPSVAGRKIALGYNKTPYDIASVTDADTVELADSYAGTTAAGTTYVIYDDVVSLASDVGTLTHVWLHDADRAYPLQVVTEKNVEHFGRYPRSSDRPWFASLIEHDSSGNRQLRLGPFAPDAVYRLEYRYLKEFTEMSSDGDTHGLNPDLDHVIVSLALAYAYRRDHYARSQRQRSLAMAELRQAWMRFRPSTDPSYLVPRSELRPHIDLPVNLDSLEIP